ncbi:MAG: SIR2 family NAD-dependent protein deacylase [Bradymonadia bacterium]
MTTPTKTPMLDFVDAQGRASLRELGAELARGRVVLFAGAGLSMNAKRKDGGHQRLPGWWSLVEKLRAGLEDDLAQEQDALRIADYFRAARGRNALVNAVMGAIPDAEYIPGAVHDRVVELNFQEIITTNFDTLLERAFEQAHIVPQVVTEGRDLARPRQPPRIIKMNGCLARNPADIVISGDDFLAYTERHRLIQVFITRCFVESRVLFVGFSLDDPAFRAIQDWVRQRLGDDVPMAWSLHLRTSATQRDYWRQRGVDLIDLSAQPSDLGPEQKITAVLDEMLHMQRQAEPPPAGRVGRRGLHDITQADPLDHNALRAVARVDGWSAGGLVLERPPWCAVAQQVDALLDDDALAPGDAVLCADLALRISALSALPEPRPSGADPLSARHNGARLLKAIERLADQPVQMLDALDPALRARGQLLICLLAPVSMCRRMVDRWTHHDGALSADLDRLTMLSFHGILSAQPGLTQQAAERLRLIGQPEGPEGSPQAQVASTRYLHLIRAVGGGVWDWPVSHLYRERLERVAGQLLLERAARPERGPVRSVLALLKEMARGALFTGPSPETLDDLWATVVQANSRNPDSVPWMAVIVITLPFEGERLIRERSRLLDGAWRRGLLDTETLTRFAAARLADGGFDGLPDRTVSGAPASGRGAGRYACGLAALLRWMIGRVDELVGSEGAAHRTLCIEALGEPLSHWLMHTPYPEVRSHLLHAWSTLGRWPEQPEQRFEVVRRWIDRHLDGPSPLQSMHLSLLDPPGQPMAVDQDRVRILLALAQADRRRGTAFRHDLQRWLIGHAQHGVLDEGTLELLARHLAECLIADADGPGFYWLSLASHIRQSDVLTGGLAVHLGAPEHPRALATFIAERFDALDEDGWARWDFSRPAYLNCLVPFAQAGELTGTLERAAGDLSPERGWSQDGMEGAVALIAAQLTASPDQPALIEALSGWIEHHATGRGTLGPVVHMLDAAHLTLLQSHLLLALDDEARRRPEEVVGWIADTLLAAPSGALPDLEAGLVAGVFRRHPGVAFATLDAVTTLIADNDRGPGFIDRHRAAIARTVSVVHRRAQHRPASRFVAQLDALAQHVT